MSNMLSLKYTPKTLDDCVLEHIDENARKLLIDAAKADKLPNVLLYGPPGTGKTTIAKILADHERFCVNEFNGSAKHSVNIEFIEHLCRSNNLFNQQRVMLIDEIDGADRRIQLALRAIMNETRVPVAWIVTANVRSALDDALLSRFIEIDCSFAQRTKQVEHKQAIASRCRTILASESITDVSDEQINEVVELNYPDVRKTLNELQMRFCVPKAA